MKQLQESEELNEMYRLYGMAAHHCSNLEYRLVSILLGPEWVAEEDLDHLKARKIYEDLSALPLGALMTKYKKHYNLSENTLEDIKFVLDKRNHLIHRFFGLYGKDMLERKTILKMIEELEQLIGIFQPASISLDPSTTK